MEIKTEKLTKKFKENTVLEDINVIFESGKIYGMMGRNGSGKSVLLKIICGLYNPTSGVVLYNGQQINNNRNFPNGIAALIEKPCFFGDLTGYENLKLLASIKKEIGDTEINNSLDIVNLLKEKDKKFSKYSLGMKQKLGIAQALMENNDVIILDEPFNGIEIDTVKKIKLCLKKMSSSGKTIIISSHIKDDVEGFCDKIYYFDNGKCIEE